MPRAYPNSSVLVAALLAILTALTFCRAARFDFVTIDDGSYVYNNPYVKTGLSQRNIVWAFTREHSANWHPVTWISHMVDVELFGLKAWGHHLTNVAIHIANAMLLYLLLVSTTGFVWRSAFVAALFAVHPLHIESVAWVSERKDVLSTLFWMLTSIAYVRYARKPSVGKYVPVILLFALGLMAKPMLVSLPIILLLMDYWPLVRGWKHHSPSPSTRQTKRDALQRSSGQANAPKGEHLANKEKVPDPIASSLPSIRSVLSAVPEKIPLFALAAASCIVTLVAQKAGGAIGSMEVYPLGVRVANALVSYIAYLWKMLWPQGLAVLYPHPGNSIPVWQVTACTLLMIALTYAAVRAARRAPYVTVGWLWYVVTLIPVIGLVQVGQQAMADRYTYIPLIGLFVIIAWGVPDLLELFGVRIKPAAIGTSATIIIFVLAVTTILNLGHWQNGVTLMQHALAVSGGHEMLRHTLADALFEAGKPEAAIRQYRLAIRRKPDFAEAYNGIGYILMRQGKTHEAEVNFRKAIRIKPTLASAHNNLGQSLLSRGRVDEAITHLKKAISLNPNNAEAQYNLGIALDRQGKTDEAALRYRSALRANPELAEAHCSLGTVFLRQGDNEKAEKEFAEALRLNPNLAEAHLCMANLTLADGNIDEATLHLKNALKIKPYWGPAHYSLALVYFRKGDYREAWKELHRAQQYGQKIDHAFIEALSLRMPEPPED